ncbi:hypothetical protein X975_11326, partial [Stegodyphus mimosarum]
MMLDSESLQTNHYKGDKIFILWSNVNHALKSEPFI